MTAYYNEHDKFAAQWLRNLIEAGHIAPGVVDERSIEDVTPNDLSGFTQCHFFAGIGGWSLAARRAGIPDSRPLWTGSCPCQPFSAAGKRAGFDDERHLWPAWHWLIRQCRPDLVVGEQVAKGGGLDWLDLVASDLEGEGFAVTSFDLCAAGFGGWHIRQRIYFTGMVRTGRAGLERQPGDGDRATGRQDPHRPAGAPVLPGELADADGGHPGAERQQPGWQHRQQSQDGGPSERLAHAHQQGSSGRGIQRPGQGNGAGAGATCERPEGLRADGSMANPTGEGPLPATYPGIHRGEEGSGAWDGEPERLSDVVWIPCRDGKFRPTEPGLFPLAHGATQRMGRLRAYGNCIHIPTATAFLRSLA